MEDPTPFIAEEVKRGIGSGTAARDDRRRAASAGANWQSDLLQLATFTIAAAYLVYKGSSESRDSDERIEQKLDALLEERGITPSAVERELPLRDQDTQP